MKESSVAVISETHAVSQPVFWVLEAWIKKITMRF